MPCLYGDERSLVNIYDKIILAKNESDSKSSTKSWITEKVEKMLNKILKSNSECVIFGLRTLPSSTMYVVSHQSALSFSMVICTK